MISIHISWALFCIVRSLLRFSLLFFAIQRVQVNTFAISTFAHTTYAIRCTHTIYWYINPFGISHQDFDFHQTAHSSAAFIAASTLLFLVAFAFVWRTSFSWTRSFVPSKFVAFFRESCLIKVQMLACACICKSLVFVERLPYGRMNEKNTSQHFSLK